MMKKMIVVYGRFVFRRNERDGEKRKTKSVMKHKRENVKLFIKNDKEWLSKQHRYRHQLEKKIQKII